ncbi:dihydroxyacetone kinase phosphoryl donor subunit DhaM [Phytobacter sp. RSE-02]|uniref:dihydroxyacetone kinase phosphoryl donor subunit DhaM n=1 Tax=Phytobacter sp. RSE-02 TaxID=3229229 RepID=UPI00339D361F
MVNLVIVSHSAQLGQGVGELARQMLTGDGCKLAIAAGIDDPDNPIGTDPIKVMEAIESVADTDHVLVMMDIGSALLSAETALELLDPDIAAKVRLCAAPLVEGTLAATVSAATGSDIDKVIADAQNALEAKRVQLGLDARQKAPPQPQTDDETHEEALTVAVTVNNPNGLHVRPASRLVAALAGFDARLLLEKEGKCVRPDSINQIALLQVRCHDTLRLIARGPQAALALAAFERLAQENFGETLTAQQPAVTPDIPVQIKGQALRYTPVELPLAQATVRTPEEEMARLHSAVKDTLDDLSDLIRLAEEKFSPEIAAIFAGHQTLLDDQELMDSAWEMLRQRKCTAEWAWHKMLMELSSQYRHLDDAYLQARYIDIEDLLHRTHLHLAQALENIPTPLRPSILIASDLYPSVMLQLEKKNIAGIALLQGSPHSHSAIIAREAGIPVLYQQVSALAKVRSGDVLTLDTARPQ